MPQKPTQPQALGSLPWPASSSSPFPVSLGTGIGCEAPMPSPVSESIPVFPREKAAVSPPGILGRLPEVGKSGAWSGSAGGAGTERSVTVRGSLRSNLFRDKS